MKKLCSSLVILLVTLTSVRAEEKVTRSTIADQKSVAITVYNVNLALVKDERELAIEKGTNRLQFMDVASAIDPTSVHIRSLGGDAFTVLEQNFEYDLLSPTKLLDKFVDREVVVEEKDVETGKLTSRKAKILSTQGGLVYEVEGKITFDFLKEGDLGGRRIIFPDIPPDLKARPTLVWLLEGRKSSTQRVEASYLTDDISWKADYVMVLGEDDDVADMNAWVTIDNKSGASYRDAELKLVAGEVQRVTDERRQFAERRATADMGMAKAPQFEEEAFFEYHLYTLGRRTTIRDRETKQLSLVEVEKIPVEKKFMYRGISRYYPVRGQREGAPDHVGVYLEFKNTAENNLGIPLPAGKMKVYKKDRKGALQFIGEDLITHTPKDERITIKTGEAFDVVAERKQTSYEKVSKGVTERSYEISLRNHKEENVKVTVIEPMVGDWKIIRSSHPYEKTSAREVRFTVDVGAGTETVVSYTVRVKY
ncbi:MAG: DUF4139 domain-containing protein [Candidatus Glassbacteria bacterium]